MRIIKVEFIDGNSKSHTLVQSKNYTPNDDDIKNAVMVAGEDHGYEIVESENQYGEKFFYSAIYVDDRNETHIVDIYITINMVILL